MKRAALALLSLLACTREAPPTATPEPAPPASASASASASAPAPALASAPASSASASGSTSSTPVNQDDPIALALGPTDAALHKAYAASKSRSLGGPHPGPFITAAEGRATGDVKKGWTVKWGRHPPAGFEIEAEATVSPSKQVKVIKAEVTFSPD